MENVHILFVHKLLSYEVPCHVKCVHYLLLCLTDYLDESEEEN